MIRTSSLIKVLLGQIKGIYLTFTLKQLNNTLAQTQLEPLFGMNTVFSLLQDALENKTLYNIRRTKKSLKEYKTLLKKRPMVYSDAYLIM